MDVRMGVAGKLGIQSVPEQPPAYEPQSNGAIECGVRQFKGLLRTLCLALEERIGAFIPVTHPVMMRLVEHTTELLAKHLVGRDGLTPYARLFGKKHRIETFEFGEQIWYAKRTVTVDQAVSPEAPASAGPSESLTGETSHRKLAISSLDGR